MPAKKHRQTIEIIKQIEKIVDSKREVSERIEHLLKGETAQTISWILDVDPETRHQVFKVLSDNQKAMVLDLVNSHTIRSLVAHLDVQDMARTIETMPAGVSQKLVSSLGRQRLDGVLPNISSETLRQQLNEYVNYPERSVGRIMQASMISVSSAVSVSKALESVAAFGSSNGMVYQIYVNDDQANFLGTIPISELVAEKPSVKINKLFLRRPPVITPLTTQRIAAQYFVDYDLVEAPVLSEGKTVGRLIVDDIIDVVQQLHTEESQKFAGISGADESLQTPVLTSSRKRLPWMIGNIFLDLIAVSIIMPFEETIAAVTSLAVLMPIVSDMGGNVGVQSLAVSIRSLSSNRPDWRLMARELAKEVRLGMLNGMVLGTIIGIISTALWQNPVLGAIVAIALAANTLLASIVGGVLPILLKRRGKDPAMMSGAILTTITDFTGFLIFLGLARAMLHLLV